MRSEDNVACEKRTGGPTGELCICKTDVFTCQVFCFCLRDYAVSLCNIAEKLGCISPGTKWKGQHKFICNASFGYMDTFICNVF
ncbi:Os06g0664200, partial [Oryza sativa Japonica Group]